jgi:hypothetical protein
MNRIGFLFLIAVLCLGPVVPVATATDYTLDLSSAVWNNPSAWSPNGYPETTSDTATIPAGYTVVFPDATTGFDVHIKSFSVGTGGTINTTGALSQGELATLTIDEDCTLNGSLILPRTSRLLINDSLTITGTGGDILLGTGTGGIGNTGNNAYVLTIADTCTGSYDGACDLDRLSCSLQIHGYGEINGSLINNAFVIADTCVFFDTEELYGSLLVLGNTMSGGGCWMANGGSLGIATEVTGDGDWACIADNCSEIVVQTCMDELTGNVLITQGKFKAKQRFCTEGDLEWISDNGSASQIIVSEDMRAEFGLSSCSSVPCP